jgi:hypothetical protein
MNPPGDTLPLRDIHLPEPVSWWPPAPGWWLLLALLLILIVAFGFAIHYYKAGALQRSAKRSLREIESAFQQDRDQQVLVQNLSVLLRRLCLSRFPREEVAGLTGNDWLARLDRTLPGNEFQQGAGRILIEAPYSTQSQIDAQALLELCKRWVARLQKSKGFRS